MSIHGFCILTWKLCHKAQCMSLLRQWDVLRFIAQMMIDDCFARSMKLWVAINVFDQIIQLCKSTHCSSLSIMHFNSWWSLQFIIFLYYSAPFCWALWSFHHLLPWRRSIWAIQRRTSQIHREASTWRILSKRQNTSYGECDGKPIIFLTPRNHQLKKPMDSDHGTHHRELTNWYPSKTAC